nr:unnamed protein product [Callosobruchus analis]
MFCMDTPGSLVEQEIVNRWKQHFSGIVSSFYVNFKDKRRVNQAVDTWKEQKYQYYVQLNSHGLTVAFHQPKTIVYMSIVHVDGEEEIAAILISFDRHAEWQSKEVKIRYVPPTHEGC